MNKETFFLKDADGANDLRNIVNSFVEKEMRITQDVTLCAILCDFDFERSDNFHMRELSNRYGLNILSNITNGFRRYVNLLSHMPDQERLKILGNVVSRYFRENIDNKYLCPDKKSVNLLNNALTDVYEYFKMFVFNLLINGKLEGIHYNILTGINMMFNWGVRTEDAKMEMSVKSKDIFDNANLSINEIDYRNDLNLINDKIEMSRCESFEISDQPNMHDATDYMYQIKPKNQKRKFIKHSDVEMNFIPFSNVEMGSMNMSDESMKRSKYHSHTIGDLSYRGSVPDAKDIMKSNQDEHDVNRIFNDSYRKYYYQNGKRVYCRIKECSDGIRVVIEPIKEYGAAFIIANKDDIDFHKDHLKINKTNSKRMNHTPGNIKKILRLVEE